MRFSMYSLLSTATCGWLAYQAYQQRRQFYPTVIHLTTSKVSMLALGNQALVLTLLFGQLCKRIFFGRLREAEVEHLYERSWYAITETCLAMTIFREEFNFRFLTLFTALLFLKIFHWLMQDRISYMEQTPNVPLMTHARMLLLMAILFAFDSALLYHAISVSIQRGPSVLLLFAFEHLILASTVCSTFSKYALHINDLRLAGRWDSKGVYMFYLELATDLFQMVVYLAFFFLICTYYGLPLHIMRDLYLTVRSFRSRVADFVRYRRVTHNMHERFPDASEEDLERFDRTCIICREQLVSAKKLACGHMFHFHCLRSWLERQQTCPTCRAPIAPPDPTPPAQSETGNPEAGAAQGGIPVFEPWMHHGDEGMGLPPQWQGIAAAGGMGGTAGVPTTATPNLMGPSGIAYGLPAVSGAQPAIGSQGIPPNLGVCPVNMMPTMGFSGSFPSVFPHLPGHVGGGFPGSAFPGGHNVYGSPYMNAMAGIGGPFPNGFPGINMPANAASNHFGTMFAPAVLLPPHLQPATNQPCTTTDFLHQQITWLQQQLDALQAARRSAIPVGGGGPSGSDGAAARTSANEWASPTRSSSAQNGSNVFCGACSHGRACATSTPSCSPVPGSAGPEPASSTGAPIEGIGCVGSANNEQAFASTSRSPVDDKESLRRARVERLASNSSNTE